MEYYIGLSIRKQTLVIQAVRNVDYLDCEIYDYLGKREIAKRCLQDSRYDLLDRYKSYRPSVYGHCRYAVVE